MSKRSTKETLLSLLVVISLMLTGCAQEAVNITQDAVNELQDKAKESETADELEDKTNMSQDVAESSQDIAESLQNTEEKDEAEDEEGAGSMGFPEESQTPTEETAENEPEQPTEEQPEAELPASSTLSYVDQCALDYVEPPVKRNREESIEKLRELSEQFPRLIDIVENEALYPDGILISLAGNPEMTDYVCGYLDADGSVTGGLTEAELAQEYPLFLQWDVRWGYYPYGLTVMGHSGCGPTCLSMAIFYLTRDETVTPDVIAQYSMDNGYYVANVGTAWALMDEYPAVHGLTSGVVGINEDAMKAELDKGNILICSVRAGNFTSGGHFITVYGYDENGFQINDPRCVYRSRLDWPYEKWSADIKRIWSIGK